MGHFRKPVDRLVKLTNRPVLRPRHDRRFIRLSVDHRFFRCGALLMSALPRERRPTHICNRRRARGAELPTPSFKFFRQRQHLANPSSGSLKDLDL
jgi:hypothetical protein